MTNNVHGEEWHKSPLTEHPNSHEVFTQLANQSYIKIYHYAHKLAENPSDAEDLTQEAYFRAYRGFHEFTDHESFDRWMYRIVHHLFVDLLRKRGRNVREIPLDQPKRNGKGEETLQIEVEDHSPTPEDVLLDNVLSEEIMKPLAKLSKSQRQLIFLADIQGLPSADIAAQLGIRVGTVRSRLHRVHQQLKHLMAS